MKKKNQHTKKLTSKIRNQPQNSNQPQMCYHPTVRMKMWDVFHIICYLFLLSDM